MGRKAALKRAFPGKRRRRSRHRHEENMTGGRCSGPIHTPPMGTCEDFIISPVKEDVNDDNGQAESTPSRELEMGNVDYTESIDANELDETETDCGEQGGEEEAMSIESARAVVPAARAGNISDTGQASSTISVSKELILDNWRVLWAFILTRGGRKLTKEQYQSVRTLAEGFSSMTATSWKVDAANVDFDAHGSRNRVSVLPHYSTIQKIYTPLVLNRLAPRAVEHEEIVDESKAGARFKSRTSDDEAKISLRTILPSEYARADMSSPAVWKEMCSTSLYAMEDAAQSAPRVSATECIDIVPLVAARAWFYGPPKSMFTDLDETASASECSSFAEVGDVVTVRVFGDQRISGFSEALKRGFGVQNSHLSIRGVFSHSWTVHSSSRANDNIYQEEYSHVLDSRDQEIFRAFNFLSYQSPTDTVALEIPPLPIPPVQNEHSLEDFREDNTMRNQSSEMIEAQKRRRAALRERNSKMDEAWRSWEKPLLKPGDFAVLLRPCIGEECNDSERDDSPRGSLLTAVDRLASVCIVHRFWAEREERSRHAFFIAGGTDVTDGREDVPLDHRSLLHYCAAVGNCTSKRYAHVRSVSLHHKHEGPRGPQRYTPVSSVGVLDTGEPYFVYRIIIFWDGFNMRNGSSASGEGVYMLSLNLPTRARSSPNAVRILSLTPPGVKATTVLDRIMRDVVRGATDGFPDYDADGTKRRIFIDLLGVVGDTPALNSALDVLGHTARACCHLCRFVRQSKTSVGSRYGSNLGDGTQTAFRRGYFQHSAVHDSGARGETCRLLGIRSNSKNTNLPLHVFRTSLFSARDGIPAVNGLRAVPYEFDPYIGAFIAPDHLLSGHLKDCISVVLKLIPSKQHLKACEKLMLKLMRDVGLPGQNRLIDHDKASLYSMSMTEMFALGLVAELGFLGGCAEVSEPPSEGNHPDLLSCMRRRAIELVASFASLIARIWYRPDVLRDGSQAVNLYERDHGTFHMMRIRKEVDAHITKVETLCTMCDEDKNMLEQGLCSRERKLELSKMYRLATIAIKCLDKPNLHRLREMVCTTLPMLGHISLVGELVLEKSHQRLKRALKLSNNREGQLEAMKSIATDDWHGRLTLVACACIENDQKALLSGYRLLSGRESVERIHGRMNDRCKTVVSRALGPGGCILSELQGQAKSVLSPRSETLGKLEWSLKCSWDRNSMDSRSINDCFRVEKYFRLAFRSALPTSVQIFADSISSHSLARLSGPSFRRGDVIEILCCRPQNHEFHFPFLLQSNSSSYPPSLSETSGAILWYISAVVQITNKDGTEIPGRSKFYLAVQPCLRAQNSNITQLVGALGQSLFDMYKVRRSSRISFAAVDSSIRRVGVVPASLTALNPVPAIVNGDPFFALTRQKGYPPRQG